MDKTVSSRELWNKASATGLILALVTIAFGVLSGLTGKAGSSIVGNALSILLGLAKIIVCIALFRYFLVKLRKSYPDAGKQDLMHYGLRIALCSSILVAGYNLLSILVINPDQVSQAVESFRTAYSQFADSNTLNALDALEAKMPVYVFFVTLAYCFVWGWVLAAIFSSSLAPSDPFGSIGNDKEEQRDGDEQQGQNI